MYYFQESKGLYGLLQRYGMTKRVMTEKTKEHKEKKKEKIDWGKAFESVQRLEKKG